MVVATAASRRCVRFYEDGNQVHELQDITESERGLYWYSKPELSEMLKTAMIDTAKALREGRLHGNSTKNSYDDTIVTLRGLEGLSKSSHARKQQAELERVKVIQFYSKEHKKFGNVDHEAVRARYQKYNEIDTKRALAYGKLDARESYCYQGSNDNSNHTKKKDKKSPSSMKGMFSWMFQSPNAKGKQNSSTRRNESITLINGNFD